MYTSSRKRGGDLLKKIIKIILLVLLIIVLNFAVLLNSVQAVEKGQIAIYGKGEFKRIIKYNGIAVKTTHAVYEKDGNEYPAYCLNKDLQGVGEYIATYDVTNQGKITDVELWRVIINGYPYKSIQQLGLENEGEAYIATKQAIYCYIYNRGTENYEGIGTAGNRVVDAINLILNNAKNSTENFDNEYIEIIQNGEWQVESDNKYISKQYEVKSGIKISKFVISLEEQPIQAKITNLENQEKNEFDSSEKFKILIPISSLEKSGEFKIKVETQMETKPIFFGKSPSEELQDYALTAFSYEDIRTELLQNYEKNKTKIIIEKQDSQTGEVLKDAEFEILDEQKQIIKTVKTDKKGQVILEQIMPGKYYIREINAPEGYEINLELVQIEIEMGEEKVLQIKNNKIVVPEPTIIEVPKLPVTGM